jgi:hypothetical protein
VDALSYVRPNPNLYKCVSGGTVSDQGIQYCRIIAGPGLIAIVVIVPTVGGICLATLICYVCPCCPMAKRRRDRLRMMGLGGEEAGMGGMGRGVAMNPMRRPQLYMGAPPVLGVPIMTTATVGGHWDGTPVTGTSVRPADQQEQQQQAPQQAAPPVLSGSAATLATWLQQRNCGEAEPTLRAAGVNSTMDLAYLDDATLASLALPPVTANKLRAALQDTHPGLSGRDGP